MRLIFAFLIVSLAAKAQIDSAQAIPLVGVYFGGDIPVGQLAKRFGPNLNLGGSYLFKTKKNWVIGGEINFMFGRNVREDVLTNLKNPDGFVVDNAGYPADLRITERAYGARVVLGRVFDVLSANPNSGLIVNLGVGYFQHKINLYDGQLQIAAIKGDLRHGYDRLTMGPSLSVFAGYLFLGESRLLNFYFGFEAVQAFTKSLRKVNYDTGLPDNRVRFDQLVGGRLGWILPLYKRKPREFYYN